MISNDSSEKELLEKKKKKTLGLNSLNEKFNINIIDQKIKPKIGSIKEVMIDGILDFRKQWNGMVWEHICRYPNCKEKIKSQFTNSLCEEHHNYQLKNTSKDEIVIRNEEKFRWNGKKWALVCKVTGCYHYALKNNSSGECKTHIANKSKPISPTEIFTQIQKTVDNKIQKESINHKLGYKLGNKPGPKKPKQLKVQESEQKESEQKIVYSLNSDSLSSSKSESLSPNETKS